MPLTTTVHKPRIAADQFSTWVETSREQRRAADAFSNLPAKLGFGSQNLLEATQYPLTRLSFNYILLQSLYRSNWIARKVVDLPAEDMTKAWISLQTDLDPKQISRFDKVVDDTQTQNQVLTTLKWGKLFGGSAAIMVIAGDENRLEEPLIVDDIAPGSYKGLIALDRWSGITPGAKVCTDINRPLDFGLPEFYQVTTMNTASFKIHSSRIIRFIGRDVPSWEKQVEQGWGISEIEVMYDELRKRDNTSWNIASLVFRALIIAIKQKDLSQMLSGIGAGPQVQKNFYAAIQAQSSLMSSQGIMVLPEDGGLDEHQYTFGGIKDVYESFKEDICGACGIPYSRMFGRPPGGLSTTNEGDEHMYYESIAAKQKRELDPQAKKLFPVIAMSTWGEVPDDFAWTWNPIRSLSNETRSALSKEKTDSVIAVYNSGLISPQTALKELKQDSEETGQWSNITDDLIDAADDQVISPMDEMQMQQDQAEADQPPDPDFPRQAADADFEESDHPRESKGKSEGGQFTAGGGGGGSTGGGSGSNLTPEESKKARKAAVAAYIGDDPYSNAIGVNGMLRKDPSKLTPKQRATVEHMDDACATAPRLKEPTTIYRGAGTDIYSGSHSIDKGFVSASASREAAEEFATSISREDIGFVYEISVPKGARLLDVSAEQSESMEYQDERVLPRESNFRRTGSPRKVGGITYVKLEYLGDGTANSFRQQKGGATKKRLPWANDAVDAADPELEAKSWKFQGLTIDIENLRGSVRHHANGSTKLTVPYGYIRRTVGADGDEVDCFIGSVADAPYAYVVHTRNLATGDYDEDKVMLGFESARTAHRTFLDNYSHPEFFESMEKMPMAELKSKLKSLRGSKLVAA